MTSRRFRGPVYFWTHSSRADSILEHFTREIETSAHCNPDGSNFHLYLILSAVVVDCATDETKL